MLKSSSPPPPPSLSSPSYSRCDSTKPLPLCLALPHHSFPIPNPTTKTLPHLRLPVLLPPAAARRVPNFPQDGGGNNDLVKDARNWGHVINSMYVEGGGGEDEDNDDEKEEDRSLDLLIRFMQNVFKKVSKRARKVVRSVLPSSISTKLVNSTGRMNRLLV